MKNEITLVCKAVSLFRPLSTDFSDRQDSMTEHAE